MIPKDGLNPQYFLAAFRRRFWYILIPFFLVSLATVIYCVKAPKMYTSTALVLIQPQEVPTDYIKSTVTTDVQARLSSITEQVMSRSKLEEIINKYNLYPEIRANSSTYVAVERMRKGIGIDVRDSKQGSRGYSGPSAFQVSFEGKEPDKTRDITQAIANLFIDYNFKLRAEQAAGTTKFLDRELERMKEELRQKEELVRQFKEQNMGLLPEQMQNNYNILTQLQQHLDSVSDGLQKTEDRKILLQTQLNKLETLGTESRAPWGESEKPLTLEELREQLKALKSRYSERHPDVIRLKAAIEKTERQQQTNSSDTNDVRSDMSAASSGSQRLMRVQREDLLVQLKMIDKDIRLLQEEKDKTSKRIEAYRQRIESGPKIEQMFVDLRRDYEQANENYQSLLKKRLQAELAENLERTQKGEQFRILDQANLPEEPSKPKIQKILGLGFMLALGCGFGLAFFLEYLDQTFWSRKEVETVLQLPVLVSVPTIITEREKRWKRIKLAASICVLLVMSSTLLYALYVLWQRNPRLLPI